jgi:hypothetical protein
MRKIRRQREFAESGEPMNLNFGGSALQTSLSSSEAWRAKCGCAASSKPQLHRLAAGNIHEAAIPEKQNG